MAMGQEVTVISTSDRKREEALGHLGAQHFLISKDEAAMKVRRRAPAPCHLLLPHIGCYFTCTGKHASVGIYQQRARPPIVYMCHPRRLLARPWRVNVGRRSAAGALVSLW